MQDADLDRAVVQFREIAADRTRQRFRAPKILGGASTDLPACATSATTARISGSACSP